MASRNITDVFLILRNNATQCKNMYAENVSFSEYLTFLEAYLTILNFQRNTEGENLLRHSLRDTEEGLELQDGHKPPPVWIDKLEEAQYTISK